MGHLLLWLESLVCSLLWFAVGMAVVARWARRLPALVVLAPLAALPLAGYLGGAIITTIVPSVRRFATGLVLPLWLLAACFLAGAVWIAVVALRRRQDLAGRAAASWPLGRLAIALAAAAALHTITFWNLDLAVGQQLGAMRAEAGALAASVAPPRVPDRDNAAIDYQEAFGRLDIRNGRPDGWREDWSRWAGGDPNGFDPNEPAPRAHLARHAPTLRLLRRGAGKPGCYFEHEYTRPSADMVLPEISGMRHSALLVALSGRVRVAARDARGAAQDASTLFAMAGHCGGPLLIGTLIGAGTEDLAFVLFQDLVASGHPPAEALEAMAIDGTTSYQRFLERSIRMEEAFRLSIFCEAGTGDGMNLADLGLSAPRFGFSAPYRVFLFREDLQAHRRLSAGYRALATRPYWKARDDWQATAGEIQRGPMGLLTALLVPALSRCAEVTAAADARRAVARTALAACCYRAARGKLPDGPEDLLGESLLVVPTDPFDGKPLKWRTAGKVLRIYSVGPDAKDDGGEPLSADKRTGDIVFRIPT